MSRYIDTKWLEENAKEYSLGYYDYDEYAVPLSALDEAPTIEPKRGEWIKDKSSPIAYRCTACNTLQHWSVIQNGKYNFCPNCGADMREESE